MTDSGPESERPLASMTSNDAFTHRNKYGLRKPFRSSQWYSIRAPSLREPGRGLAQLGASRDISFHVIVILTCCSDLRSEIFLFASFDATVVLIFTFVWHGLLDWQCWWSLFPRIHMCGSQLAVQR